jgi:RHS repeat-associated protein
MTHNCWSKNNGQIVSSVDAVTAETITYQYDALKRLLAASGKNWGETYAYDGFGNLLQMSPTGTAGAPSLSVMVGSTTNRLTTQGAVYDNNRNLTSGLGGLSLVYDTDNRLTEVENSVGDYYYAYDSDNHRIYYRNASNSETIYFYGADGRKITSYTMTFLAYGAGIQMNPAAGGGNVYFAGILLAEEGNSVTTDRLGSVPWGGPSGLGYQAQYPYGVEYTTTANGREKYATYTRDSDSVLDYAVNRYYSSQWGRFLSPDGRWRSAKPGNPQSWNRYAYVLGDPINLTDPTGQYYCAPVGGYDPCPPAFGLLDGAGDAQYDDGDDETPGGGGCSGDGNNFGSEVPDPGPCAPPPEPEPQPPCTDWGCMPPAFARAAEALTLDPSCFDLYGNAKSRSGKWNPVLVLTSLFVGQTGTYGTVDFNYTGNAAAVTSPTGFPILPSFTQGLTGTSANISMNAQYWNIDNVGYNAETLLHEMAHLYDFVRGSGAFAVSNIAELTNSGAFDAIIHKDCGL